jgi:hypothetical protein
MSSIVIKGNTSGQVEIAAPDVAGSTTLTLPTGSGNILTDVSPKVGNVLQVVNSTSPSNFSTRSVTPVDTGYSLSITPSSSSSKIAIFLNAKLFLQTATTPQNYVYGQACLYRGTTQLQCCGFSVNSGTTSMTDASGSAIIQYLDSPNTTSSVTYRLYISALGQDFLVSINSIGGASNMTLMEVAG